MAAKSADPEPRGPDGPPQQHQQGEGRGGGGGRDVLKTSAVRSWAAPSVVSKGLLVPWDWVQMGACRCVFWDETGVRVLCDVQGRGLCDTSTGGRIVTVGRRESGRYNGGRCGSGRCGTGSGRYNGGRYDSASSVAILVCCVAPMVSAPRCSMFSGVSGAMNRTCLPIYSGPGWRPSGADRAPGRFYPAPVYFERPKLPPAIGCLAPRLDGRCNVYREHLVRLLPKARWRVNIYRSARSAHLPEMRVFCAIALCFEIEILNSFYEE